MNPTEHPDESLLLRFAMNESGLADSATIRNHVAACPQCRRYVDTTRAMEDALRNERTWGTTRDGKSLQSRIVEFRERLRREDAEARDLLNKPLESEYTFHYEKIAAKGRYHTGGVVRLLVSKATEECERKPLYAVSLAESAHKIAHALPDNYYPANGVFELRGDASMALANAHRYLGNFEDGRSALDEAEAAYKALPTPGPRLLRVKHGRASSLFRQQRYDEALTLANHLAKAAVSYGETNEFRKALQLIAAIYMRTGRRLEARDVFAKLHHIAQRSGDPELEARAAVNLGTCHWEMGDFSAAGNLLLQAKKIFEELGRPTEALRARWSIAALATATGRAPEAARELREVVLEYERDGMASDAATAKLDLAEALLVLDDFVEVMKITEPLIEYFVSAGMAKGAVRAAAFLRDATRERRLTREKIQSVRTYLRRLKLEPELPFVPPADDSDVTNS